MAIMEQETSETHKTLKPIFEIHSMGVGGVMESDTVERAVCLHFRGRNLITNFMCVSNTSSIRNWKHMFGFYVDVGALKFFISIFLTRAQQFPSSRGGDDGELMRAI